MRTTKSSSGRLLAAVSVDYYTRLERGNVNGVCDGVLEALARALQLDEAEHAHLFDLARAARPAGPARRRPATQQQVRPSVQRILDALDLLASWAATPQQAGAPGLGV